MQLAVLIATMYIYIVKRTQIYLDEELDAELARRSAATGLTKSQLIRDAIEKVYLQARDEERALRGLEASAGGWKRRQSGGRYVEGLRRGRLATLYAAEDEA